LLHSTSGSFDAISKCAEANERVLDEVCQPAHNEHHKGAAARGRMHLVASKCTDSSFSGAHSETRTLPFTALHLSTKRWMVAAAGGARECVAVDSAAGICQCSAAPCCKCFRKQRAEGCWAKIM